MSNQSTNIVWHQGQITKAKRTELMGQASKTIWLTGLSGAGKSTLASALEYQLVSMGKFCYVLDGDNIRHGLNKDLGFSPESRTENIRRIAEVAKLMNDAGLIVISAFISPLKSDRQSARDIIGEDFREVYVSTALNVCESRDSKGLYAKARAGQLAEFTGISAPYEAPSSPDIKVDTSVGSIEDQVRLLVDLALA